MSYTMLKRNIKSGLKLAVIFIAVLFMYTSLIISMFDEGIAYMLDRIKEIMPQLMSAVGMSGGCGTLLEFVNTYLNGFLMLVLPMILTMLLVNIYVMRYMDNGSMASILASPNSRRKIILTQLFSIMFIQMLVFTVTTIIGVVSASIMFSGALEVPKYILMNMQMLFMQFLIGGICYLSACFFNETRWYLTCGVGIPVLFYVIQMIANMGGKLDKMKYLTVYSLIGNQQIIDGNYGQAATKTIIVLIMSVVMYIAGTEIFARKDLQL